jgi:putative membrane protein
MVLSPAALSSLLWVVKAPRDDAAIMAIERPDPALWTYYLLRCLVIPPLFPILVLPAYFRYHTMRYQFTEEGISMKWGILFRREIILNYARIQDIHLRSNVIERWLGLARILIQTASGSSSAEMTIEGIKNFEELRDFLYARMRGVRDASQHRSEAVTGRAQAATVDARALGELTGMLREVCAELRAVRTELGQRTSTPTER